MKVVFKELGLQLPQLLKRHPIGDGRIVTPLHFRQGIARQVQHKDMGHGAPAQAALGVVKNAHALQGCLPVFGAQGQAGFFLQLALGRGLQGIALL